MRPSIRALALALASACSGSSAGVSPFTTGVAASTTDDSAGGTTLEPPARTTGGESSTGAASSDSGGLSLDVGTDIDLGDGKPIGCRGKIDFLFVISRYAGMEGFQNQLLTAFPDFIATIEEKFPDFDHHIMVVDGDPYWGLETCDAQCPVQCVPNYPCDYTPTYCDLAMGAGTVFPAGDDAANKLCGIADGRRYMVKGQPNLKDTFACTAQIGSSGGDWLGEALTAAVHSNTNDPGGCNPGFLRKDALLLITFISNTYDSPVKPFGSLGSPETWTAAVAKAKHDDLESVVLLNIGDTTVPGCHEKDRLCQMTKLFPYAMNTEIWADDYRPFFDAATDLVETACADFVPPQ